MSNSASTPTDRGDATTGSHLTVEDTGSTVDAADLVGDGASSGPTSQGGAHAVSGADDARGSGIGSGTRNDDTVGSGTRADDAVGSRGDDLPSAPGATTSGLSSLIADDDGSIGHVFDQTNGVVDRLDGDSDGTAESDELSAEERRDENPAFDAFTDTESQRGSGTDDPRLTGN